jgi:AcrR family transcriptional regulator
MPRAGLSSEAVVAAAAQLADAEGLQALTLAALAARLGVRAPSLYAHVAGLEDLRERLAARAAAELADALQAAAAGRAGTEALSAVAHAYRCYARRHQGTYEALQRAARSPEGEAQAQATRVLEVVLAALRAYRLEGEDAIHAVRAIRAALHGFVSLEAEQGFGLALSTEDSFEALVAMLDAGLKALPAPA